MKPTRLIAGMTRQVLAAWIVVLLLLLAWTACTATPQAQSGLSLRSDSISITGMPELAAVQVKTGQAQRATDDRTGSGPDGLLPGAWNAPAFVPALSELMAAVYAESPPERVHSPHSPRAPPAA